MADFPSDRPVARPERDAWPHDNHRGLSLAEAGDWAEAAEAFASAADCLARSLPDARAVAGESHLEPLALVLGNLAQACFRLGRLDEALRHAQRACALRVAITGEDGMPVARTRMDIAVMLASGGRLDEATALIQRAIAGIEHRVGEEDERLAPVLENAARIALASGQPANAEPLLLRLHALLDAHDRSTASADLLLAQVAAVRAHQRAAVAVPAAAPERVVAVAPERVVAAAPERVVAAVPARVVAPAPARVVAPAPAPVPAAVPVKTPVSSAYVDGFDDASPRVYAHASITDRADWEDQPLRDAVVVTDHLLRITPTGVPVVPTTALLEPPDLAVNDETVDEAAALHDPIDVPDALPAPSLREPVTERLPSVDPVIDAEADGDASMADDEAAVVQAAPISPPEPNAEAAMTPAPARFAPTPAGGQQPVARPPEARVVLPEPTESPGHHRLIAIVAAVVAAAAAGGAAAFFALR
ncbi:tetratricopeptide repeat protein [Gemmatimonas sp.]|uniref:tetratricopeptide repeat protein n=1 Tax=Gemmatimonas sp. TaxID=1962908 RepID=UPI0025C2EF59|nr:tetratricopeptide repeat protein [Gemmatimonas sp.]MCA2993279.1 tetratricopeptide repeat protein [Gemmatimonas sp.]